MKRFNILKPGSIVMLLAILCQLVILPAQAADYPNVALNKKTTTTSDYSLSWSGPGAVDGNMNVGWASGDVPESSPVPLKNGEQQGIVIDLEGTYKIYEIAVRTRRDLDSTWDRRGWRVYVSDNAGFTNAELVGTKELSGLFGEDLEIKFTSPKQCRYIMVAATFTTLTVSEIEAYGEEVIANLGLQPYEGLEASNASYLIQYLNIIPNKGQDFEALKLIQRKEVARMVLDLMNRKAGEAKKYFNDVDLDNPYAADISTCTDYGIIRQASNFRPDDYVTVAEFAAMLVRAAGYSGHKIVELSFHDEYMNRATELEIIDYDMLPSDKVNRETAVEMMYKTLCAPRIVVDMPYPGINKVNIDSDVSVLEYYHDLELRRGIVTENNETTFYTPAEKGRDHIKIGNEVYADASGTMYKMLGKSVYYLVDVEETNTVLASWEDTKRNNVIRVQGEDLTDISALKAYYTDEDGKNRKLNIENAHILKNNVAFADYIYDLSSFVYDDSYIEFIDNNSDENIDLINIMIPTVFIVEKITAEEDSIVISTRNSEGKTYTYSDYDTVNVYLNGKPSSIKGFSGSSVVYAYLTEKNINLNLWGYATTANGKLTSTSNETFKLDDTTYSMSDFFLNNKSISAYKVGSSINAYVVNDEIVWIDADAYDTGELIGYITRFMHTEDDMFDSLKVRVFAENGVFADYIMKDYIMLDDSKISVEDIMGNIQPYLGNFYRMTVKNSVVKKLASVEAAENVTPTCYRSGTGIFSELNMVLPVANETPMFMIPYFENQPLLDSAYETYYSISQFSHRYYNGKTIYENDAFYEIDEEGYPEFGMGTVVTHATEKNYRPCGIGDGDLVAVTGIAQSIDGNDESCFEIVGIDLKNGTSVRLLVIPELTKVIKTIDVIDGGANGTEYDSDNIIKDSAALDEKYLEDIANLKAGDILRISKINDMVTGLELVQSRNNPKQFVYTAVNGKSKAYADVCLIGGVVDNVSNGNIKYSHKSGSEIRKYNEFESFYVVEGKRVEKKAISEIPNYFKNDVSCFVYKKMSTPKILVIFSD